MKTFAITCIAAFGLTFTSCEKCYECEGAFGITTDCCGKKSDCEKYRGDCTLAGGVIK